MTKLRRNSQKEGLMPKGSKLENKEWHTAEFDLFAIHVYNYTNTSEWEWKINTFKGKFTSTSSFPNKELAYENAIRVSARIVDRILEDLSMEQSCRY